MAAKLSKEITHRMRAGLFVLSAFETEGASVAASFADAAEPHLEDGDDEPRPTAFLAALCRRLKAALDRLVEADARVSEAAALESALRGERKRENRQLGFKIVALRHLVLGQYVRPDLDNLALQPLEARDSITVVRRAELIGERFEAVNLAKLLGEPHFDEAVDVKKHVEEVRAKSADLLALAGEIDLAHRATDRARIERDEARDDYDRVFLRTARIFEDLCRLAGRDELAARVRTSAGRPRRDEETQRPDETQRLEETQRREVARPDAGALRDPGDRPARIAATQEIPRPDDGGRYRGPTSTISPSSPWRPATPSPSAAAPS